MSTQDERLFHSSDSVRSARPLRDAHYVTLSEPLTLEHGDRLPAVTVAYETYGQLNRQRDNAVLICHAISGDSHVARHDDRDDPGWWDWMVGPGRPIDTRELFVVCSNVLGGCRGTTGPGSIDPATGQYWGTRFPLITVGDMVEVQWRLTRHLGIDAWLAVAGGSLGGHQAMEWALRYPRAVRGCIAIATSSRLTSQALAFDVVARNAILRDPHFHGGRYYDKPTTPDTGLAIARMLGHITYLSPQAMGRKFDIDRNRPREVQTEFEKRFSVGSYLAYQGDRFVERFDANSYVTLSLAIDMFDLGVTAEELRSAFSRSRCAWQLVSFSSDWLFTPAQSRAIVDALIQNDHDVGYCEINSDAGHDGFLLDGEIQRYGQVVQAFLQRLRGEIDLPEALRRDEGPAYGCEATSIYHGSRLDMDMLLSLIEPGASVLDLGCGRGLLLAELKLRGHQRVLGVEVDEANIIAATRKGLDVIDHDLNTGLAAFRDNQFDMVVLSQTIQALHNTELVIDEMLRVGKRGIVCFPNFAFHRLRRMLHDDGVAPKLPGAYQYEWYNTPNRRFPTIADFDAFCHQKRIAVDTAVYLNSETDEVVTHDPNWNADIAIYVLGR
jgi:homoserine O-acetyltransferase